MPDDHAHAADVAGKIGNEKIRAREYLSTKNEIPDEHHRAALEHIKKESRRADLQSELTAHIHRARVAAAHLAHVLMLDLGDQQREIETPHEVGRNRQHRKDPPYVPKQNFIHN